MDQSFWVVLAIGVVAAIVFSRMQTHSRDVEPLIVCSIFVILVSAIVPSTMHAYDFQAKLLAEKGVSLTLGGTIGLGFISLGLGIVTGLLGLALLVLAWFAIAWTCIGIYRIGEWAWSAPTSELQPPAAAPPAKGHPGQETEDSV